MLRRCVIMMFIYSFCQYLSVSVIFVLMFRFWAILISREVRNSPHCRMSFRLYVNLALRPLRFSCFSCTWILTSIILSFAHCLGLPMLSFVTVVIQFLYFPSISQDSICLLSSPLYLCQVARFPLFYF